MHESAPLPASLPQERPVLSLSIQVHLVDNSRYPCSWSIGRTEDFFHSVNEIFAAAGIRFEPTIVHSKVHENLLEAAFDDPEHDEPKGTRKTSALPLMATENYLPNTLNLFLLDTCVELGTGARIPGSVFKTIALFSVYSRDKFVRNHCTRLGVLLGLRTDKDNPGHYLMNYNGEGSEFKESEVETLRATVLRLREDRPQQPPPAGSYTEMTLPVQAHLVSNSKYTCGWSRQRLLGYFRDLNTFLAQARIRVEPTIVTTTVPTEALESAFQQNPERKPGGSCQLLQKLDGYIAGKINLFFLDVIPVLSSGRISSMEIYSAPSLALVSLYERKMRSHALMLARVCKVPYVQGAAEPSLMSWANEGAVLDRSEIELMRENARALVPAPPKQELLVLPIRAHLIQNAKYHCSWQPDQVLQFLEEVNKQFAQAQLQFEAEVLRTSVSTENLEAAFYDLEQDAAQGKRSAHGKGLQSSENYLPETLNLYFLDGSVNLVASRPIYGIPLESTGTALLSVNVPTDQFRNHCVRIAFLLKLTLDAQAPKQCLMNWTNTGFELRPAEQEKLRSEASQRIQALQSARKAAQGETQEEVLSELDALIGRQDFKAEFRRLANFLKIEALRRRRQGEAAGEPLVVNLLLSGNPGTGMSKAAELLGRLLKSVGGLSGGHLVELDRSSTRSAEAYTAAIERALGGVLLVKDAEHLIQSIHDSGGKAAVATLLSRLRSDKGRFAFVLAGESEGLEDFVKAQGFDPFFRHHFSLSDFSAEELALLFQRFARQKGLELPEDTLERLTSLMRTVSKQKGTRFGNLRVVQELLETAVEQQADRLGGLEHVSDEELFRLRPEDLPQRSAGLWRTQAAQEGGTRVSEPPASDSLEQVLLEVDRMIGLPKVKAKIHQLVNFFKVEKMRDKQTPIAIHMVFAGAPGTGKTTVARLMGRLFKALELLGRGQLVETDRSGLVASYLGQTAPKTNAIIDQALHGVLFIDEAYALKMRDDDSFGLEAINTLLKRMEDSYDKLCVIAAGYTQEMETFLNANPGLQSRMQHRLEFENYTPEELAEIFRFMARSRGFQLGSGAEERVAAELATVPSSELGVFGNGRGVRNFFEHCLERQAARLATTPAAKEDLSILIAEDILLHPWRPQKKQQRIGFRQG
ncbi:MAG: AAA family ATPase [Candidatus Eremiobacteraeota bacterium]|nr:AAA family ATPase [Candidatus Eremiobacteraeota bacterium]